MDDMVAIGNRFARVTVACTAVLLFASGCSTPVPPAALTGQSYGQRVVETDTAPPAFTQEEQLRRASIRVELASGYFQQGNSPVALAELRQAVAMAPKLQSAWGMLALVHMQLGERAKAAESFEKALAIAPDDAELNNNYGWFLCQNGKETAALPLFVKALRDPLYATPGRALQNAGLCARKMGNDQMAESYFRESFRIDPGNPVAMFQLSELALRRGEYVDARFHAQRLLRLQDATAQMLWLAWRVERGAGDVSAAENYAAQLRRRFPGAAETELLNRGSQ